MKNGDVYHRRLVLQSFLLLDVEEVLVGVYSELSASFFITGDDSSIVHLKSAAGPLLGYSAFNYSSHSSCLVVS